MTLREGQEVLEAQFEQWRRYVLRRRELQPSDVDELEDHLRGSVDELIAAGLSPDEAFLVAVKRMGSLDELSREFAREHSERLWKQLVLTGDPDSPAADTHSRRGPWGVGFCGGGAGGGLQGAGVFGVRVGGGRGVYARDFLPFCPPSPWGFPSRGRDG